MGTLFFIFTCIFVLAAVSLHISFLIEGEKSFDKVVRFFLVLVIIQVMYTFFVYLAPYEYRYIDRGEPLGLLYGPLLYFAYITSGGFELNKKIVFIHALPFIVAVPFYALFLTIESFRNQESLYLSFLYGSFALSWLGYASLVGYKSTSPKHREFPINKVLPMILVLILFVLAFYFILLVGTRTIKGISVQAITSSLMIYAATLGAVLSVYLFLIRRLKEKIYAVKAEFEKLNEDNEEVSTSYVKSGVQTNDIDEYAKKVNVYFSTKKYLDPRFSLNMMSSELKIPRHHLSQLFNQYYGQSFLKYINSLRIMHACELLEVLDLESNIEDLSEQCGFNSKTSFYRNFREIAKMTPTEFLSRSKKDE